MCGIFGYYNFGVTRDRATILQFLINGLRRLEYRGYDSSGICIDGVDGLPEAVCIGSTPVKDSQTNGVILTQILLALLSPNEFGDIDRGDRCSTACI